MNTLAHLGGKPLWELVRSGSITHRKAECEWLCSPAPQVNTDLLNQGTKNHVHVRPDRGQWI